jgi:16S rRNA processing protein RimM
MPARILMGVLGRPHGVRGHMRVQSYAAQPEDLTAYGPLCDADGRWFSLRWQGPGVVEVARLDGGTRVPLGDRAAAERLVNTRLFLPRDRLPAPDPEEFYLADLVGLEACDAEGATLGPVRAVHDFGAGASLEVASSRTGPLLVPFTRAAVPRIDLAAGRVTVVPPAEIEAP